MDKVFAHPAYQAKQNLGDRSDVFNFGQRLGWPAAAKFGTAADKPPLPGIIQAAARTPFDGKMVLLRNFAAVRRDKPDGPPR